MKTIIVLPDGETWDTIAGCTVCVISDEEFNSLCNDEIGANSVHPLVEIGLQSYA